MVNILSKGYKMNTNFFSLNLSKIYVGIYLIAVILANLSSAYFGPGASIINAALFIGLDLSSRDRLHDAWHGRWLWPKMAALIAVGSLLSWWFNRNAGQIALASFVAFLAAGAVDAVTYGLLHRYQYLIRCNGSNVVSGLVDSILFPALAFPGLPTMVLLGIIGGQFVAKVGGGFVWSLILGKGKTNEQKTG